MGRIVLVRHGRSAHVAAGWVDVHGFHRWREEYEGVGIARGERVPRDLQAIADHARIVVASDAPRAIESARLVRPDTDLVISPLLREVEMRPPAVGRMRLPLALWALMLAPRWLRKSVTDAEAARAREAARWLIALSEEHGDVLAVTHGWFRGALARALKDAGWTTAEARRSHHWSAWVFALHHRA